MLHSVDGFSQPISHSKRRSSSQFTDPFRNYHLIHQSPDSIFGFNSTFIKFNTTSKFRADPKQDLNTITIQLKQTLKNKDNPLQNKSLNSKHIMEVKNKYKGSIRERIRKIMNTSLKDIDQQEKQLILPRYMSSAGKRRQHTVPKKGTPRYRNNEESGSMGTNKSYNQSNRYSKYILDYVNESIEKPNLNRTSATFEKCQSSSMIPQGQTLSRLKVRTRNNSRNNTEQQDKKRGTSGEVLSMTGLDFRRLIKPRSKAKAIRTEQHNQINPWQMGDDQEGF